LKSSSSERFLWHNGTERVYRIVRNSCFAGTPKINRLVPPKPHALNPRTIYPCKPVYLKLSLKRKKTLASRIVRLGFALLEFSTAQPLLLEQVWKVFRVTKQLVPDLKRPLVAINLDKVTK